MNLPLDSTSDTPSTSANIKEADRIRPETERRLEELEWENQALRKAITSSSSSIQFGIGRKRILNQIAEDKSLGEILAAIVAYVEELNSDMLCCILLVDKDQQCLRYGASISLPNSYSQAIDGIRIGPKVGCCGRSAYTGKRVVVENLDENSLCESHKQIASKAGLKACWSEPILSASGQVLGTFAIYHATYRAPNSDDLITISLSADLAAMAIESKRNSSTLRRKQHDLDLLRTLINRSNDSIFVIDPQSALILDCNQQVCHRLNYSHEELMQMHVWEINTVIPGKITWEAHVAKVRHSGGLIVEGQQRRKDGSMFPTETNVKYITQGGKNYILGIARDISERKRASAELTQASRLLESSQSLAKVGGWELDLASMSLYWTEETYRIHETNPGNYTPSYETAVKFYTLESSAVIEETLRHTIETGEPKSLELELTTAKKRRRWVKVTTEPVFVDGQITKLIGAIQDITSQKNLELSLKDARDKALEASRLKSEFLTVMSHEIRTPLNGVIGMTNLLLKTPLDQQQMQMGKIIKVSGSNLLSIVNDILDFSKIDVSKLELNNTRFSLTNLLNHSVNLLAPSATEKKLELKPYIADEFQQYVTGDMLRVRQIVINLISNAIKFTERGSIEIKITSTEQEGAVRFEISDTGIGIAPKNFATVFDAFTQVDGSNTRKYEGTGLGLAISKQLVELMGGEIGVESVEGEGSTFWFELPLAFSSHHNGDDANDQGIEALKVLVIQSHPQTSDRLAEEVTLWGHKAQLATGFDEAVAALIQDACGAIIFTDFDVDAQSHDLACKIREGRLLGVSKTLPIIALVHDHRAEDTIAMTVNKLGIKVFKSNERSRVQTQLASTTRPVQDRPTSIKPQ